MKQQQFLTVGIIALLVMLGVSTRLLVDLPANFTALGAIAIISGYYLQDKWSWVVPIALLFCTDLFLGLYAPIIMASVYGSYALAWGLGRWAQSQKHVGSLLPATVLGAIAFYAITNFAVWAFSPLYAKSVAGLLQSYYMALPFFRSSLLGDMVFVTALASVIELASYFAVRESKIIPISVDSN